MKTREVLTTEEAVLVPKLKQMKIKDLERHAQKILRSQGQSDYQQVIAAVIRAVPTLEVGSTQAYQGIQSIIKTFLPHSDSETSTQAIVERLAAIILVLLAKKFQKIHESNM